MRTREIQAELTVRARRAGYDTVLVSGHAAPCLARMLQRLDRALVVTPREAVYSRLGAPSAVYEDSA